MRRSVNPPAKLGREAIYDELRGAHTTRNRPGRVRASGLRPQSFAVRRRKRCASADGSRKERACRKNIRRWRECYNTFCPLPWAELLWWHCVPSPTASRARIGGPPARSPRSETDA